MMGPNRIRIRALVPYADLSPLIALSQCSAVASPLGMDIVCHGGQDRR